MLTRLSWYWLSYFKENNLSTHANAAMVFKTIVMLSLYYVPYFLMITNAFTNVFNGESGNIAINPLGTYMYTDICYVSTN